MPPAEREPLRDWSLAILGALEPVVTQDAALRGNQAVTEFLDYLKVLTADRRARPGDPERDVLTRLLQADPSGDQLTQAELLHNCIFLLNAGHETTTNLIGNGLVALAQHPEERARLLADPAMVRSTVEEVLRYESSNQLGNRITQRRPNSAARPIRPARWSPYASAPPTATRPFSSTPIGSISAARRTATWPSPQASTNASA